MRHIPWEGCGLRSRQACHVWTPTHGLTLGAPYRGRRIRASSRQRGSLRMKPGTRTRSRTSIRPLLGSAGRSSGGLRLAAVGHARHARIRPGGEPGRGVGAQNPFVLPLHLCLKPRASDLLIGQRPLGRCPIQRLEACVGFPQCKMKALNLRRIDLVATTAPAGSLSASKTHAWVWSVRVVPTWLDARAPCPSRSRDVAILVRLLLLNRAAAQAHAAGKAAPQQPAWPPTGVDVL